MYAKPVFSNKDNALRTSRDDTREKREPKQRKDHCAFKALNAHMTSSISVLFHSPLHSFSSLLPAPPTAILTIPPSSWWERRRTLGTPFKSFKHFDNDNCT